jgi:hypothetical protein
MRTYGERDEKKHENYERAISAHKKENIVMWMKEYLHRRMDRSPMGKKVFGLVSGKSFAERI